MGMACTRMGKKIYCKHRAEDGRIRAMLGGALNVNNFRVFPIGAQPMRGRSGGATWAKPKPQSIAGHLFWGSPCVNRAKRSAQSITSIRLQREDSGAWEAST